MKDEERRLNNNAFKPGGAESSAHFKEFLKGVDGLSIKTNHGEPGNGLDTGNGASNGVSNVAKVKFNPSKLFNPRASLDVITPGSSAGSAGSAGSSGSANASANGSFNPQTPQLGSKKFNPASTFSPKRTRPAGPSAPSGASGVVAPSGLGLPSVVMSNMTPMETTATAAEYSQLYHPPLHPAQYNLYAPTPFRVRPPLEAHQRLAEDLFISNEYRKELQTRNEACLQVLPHSQLPEFVHVYHSLFPLDVQASSTDEFGYKKWNYKAISNTDGRTYCLLRLENFKLKDKAFYNIKFWSKTKSAALVGVVEAFTTLAFGDHSLIVVYEYYPMSMKFVTYFSNQIASSGDDFVVKIAKHQVWQVVTQLISGIHAAHAHDLAIRNLSFSRLIVTQKDRVRIIGNALNDVIDFSDTANEREITEDRKRQDWHDLGELMSKFKTKMPSEFHEAVEWLLSDPESSRDSNETYTKLAAILSQPILRAMDMAMVERDTMEDTLSQELENGRLFRLLAKIEFVIGWPEHANDQRWQPSGEMYPLILFRDYVFHQKTETGSPSLDLAHALLALNKLDAGVEEHVFLISHDEQTRMVLTFQHLKQLCQTAFSELSRRGAVVV